MIHLQEDFGIETYQVPKYRGKEVVLYDFGKKRSPMTKEKKESYMEWSAKKKANLPAPTQYSPITKIAEGRKIYHKIYTTQRKTDIDILLEKE